MGATSMALAQYLGTRAKINYTTAELARMSTLYGNNQDKLAKQMKYEEKWINEYDKARDETRTTALKGGGINIKKETAATEEQAEAWANYKVNEYDEELSLELADLDIEYDTMKTMYETTLETLRAQEENEKTLTSENAQDTGLLNAG